MSTTEPTTPADSTAPAQLASYVARHTADQDGYTACLADLLHMLDVGLTSVAEHARGLAAIVPQLEQQQRALLMQGDEIDAFARHHGAAPVTTRRELEEWLTTLTEPQRRVYDAARLGAQQAAVALGRHAIPPTPDSSQTGS
ncbi:hypothetical protein [Streptomyces sp. NPDC088736]|uniref:hypothetical protein n=1 Tax=Streptomyces sp. NPDC088736 TaxID=3365881 RepID=UPI003830CC3E